jgi:hypothetical protein
VFTTGPCFIEERREQSLGGSIRRFRFKTLREMASVSLADRQLVLRLLAFFGALAIVLATTGVYSVVSYMASRSRIVRINAVLFIARRARDAAITPRREQTARAERPSATAVSRHVAVSARFAGTLRLTASLVQPASPRTGDVHGSGAMSPSAGSRLRRVASIAEYTGPLTLMPRASVSSTVVVKPRARTMTRNA